MIWKCNVDSINKRTRVVSFRVSENEYTELVEMCHSTGVRSVSEMARAAVCDLSAPRHEGDPLSVLHRVARLEVEVQELSRAVRELSAPLDSSPACSTHELSPAN